MTPQDLIKALREAGASLSAQEGKLKFDGPAELLQLHKELIADLRPQLVELLSQPAPCACEVLDGFRYLCPAHQDTPSGRCLVEPAPDGQLADLVEKAVLLFGGRALAGGP